MVSFQKKLFVKNQNMQAFWDQKASQTAYRPDVKKTNRNLFKNTRYVPMSSASYSAYIEQDKENSWISSLTKGMPNTAFDLYLLPRGCILLYIPNYLDQSRCGLESPLRTCLDSLPMTKDHLVPREYIGFKRSKMPLPISDLCDEIDSKVNFGLGSVFINKYRKDKILDGSGNWIAGAGRDSIADHSDREMWHLEHQVIVCVSVGQKRRFIVKYKNPDRDDKIEGNVEFRLGGGDLLVMAGNTNKYCTHGVPKEEEAVITDHRYSLTMRPRRQCDDLELGDDNDNDVYNYNNAYPRNKDGK